MNLGVKGRTHHDPAFTVIDSMDTGTGWTAADPGNQNTWLGSTFFSIPPAVGIELCGWNGGGAASGLVKTFGALNLSAASTLAFYVYTEEVLLADRDLTVRFGTSSTVYWQKVVSGSRIVDRAHTLIELSRANDFTAVGGISAWTAITYLAFLMNTSGSGKCGIDQIVAL